MIYCQVELVNGTRTRVSWIPEEFAVVGKKLVIKGEAGWVVVNAWSTLDFGTLQTVNEARRHLVRCIEEDDLAR